MNQRHHGLVSGGSARVRLAIGVFCAALRGTGGLAAFAAPAPPESMHALAASTAGAAEACTQAGVYFQSDATIDTGGRGPVTIEVIAASGAQEFTFASGTTQANIVSALNTFSLTLGIEAAAASPARVGIFAAAHGPTGFVRVRQLTGGELRVYAEASGGVASDDVSDVGASALPGDANCDAVIDALDVLDLLAQWGACPRTPACPGDLDGDHTVDPDDLAVLLENWTF